MLQRAASNAFSWWWASHIRTKQSKWLEQSLIDMEEKVHNALNIIQKDGDSFGKRAEMYYRHRPDLICFVEETFRAYRSLAERYDKLSKDLQKANTTIASIFPDQVSYDDFDDDDGPPKMPRNITPPQNQGPNAAKIPKVPQFPTKNLKGLITNASKKMQVSKAFKEDNPKRIVPKSGLTEEEAFEEIDKIQKEILSLQTMKEFTKSAYENGLSKYWEIENKINTMQQKVCRLEDEFKVGRVIEDGDARTVMARAALKSCNETLDKLEEKRENSAQAGKAEHEKILDAKQKIIALKHKYHPKEVDAGESEPVSNKENDKEATGNIKKSSEQVSKKQLTVSGLAESIDKVANTVISLESTVSSQTANIDKLRTQAGELQTQIQNLESEVATMENEDQIRKKLKILDKKIHRLQELEMEVEKENRDLNVYFGGARSNIEYLSERLHDLQPDEDTEMYSPASEEGGIDEVCNDDENQNMISEERDVHCIGDHNIFRKTVDDDDDDDDDYVEEDEDDDGDSSSYTADTRGNLNDDEEDIKEITHKKKFQKKVYEEKDSDIRKGDVLTKEKKDLTEMGDSTRETIKETQKNPLKQYTTTLKNYKERKKKLSEEEKKKLETLFELIVLVRELKTGIVKRDSEIQVLKQKLNQIQSEENWQEVKQDDYLPIEEKEEEEINISIDDPEPVSEIEEKFRTDIDAILDENLDFWLRFSTQFHQVQKFKTEVNDLKIEINKVKAKARGTSSNEDSRSNQSMFTTDLRSEIRPIYKHLKEIQGELTLWLEQAGNLKEELHWRCSSLSNIKEEITMALKEGMLEDEIKFSTHHAAKFQGELLNMEQENNRVNEELEAGLDHIRKLHHEIKRILRRLEEEFGISDNQNPYRQPSVRSPTSRPGIPLRSFIFGAKAKKQKPSIFNVINNHKKTKGSRT